MSGEGPIAETCVAVIEFLEQSDAPEASTLEMRGMTLPEDAETLLDRAEELSLCLAYIDHKSLAKLLLAALEVLCKDLEKDRKKGWRKWMMNSKDEVIKYEKRDDIPNGEKREPEEMEKVKAVRDELDDKAARVASKYYKYRQLIPQLDVVAESDGAVERAGE